MEQVELKVSVQDNGALKTLQESVNALKNEPIILKVKAEGLTKVDKSVIKLAQEQAKLAKTEAQLQIAREKTAQATQTRLTAEAKLSTQMEKTATAEESARVANTNLSREIQKTATAQAQQALQAEKTATEQAKLAVETQRTETANAKASGAAKTNADATKSAGDAAKTAGTAFETLWANVSKFATWYLIGNAFSSMVRSMTDALETMKAVDDELVTVRKVTGASADELKALEERAYSTASAYGKVADEYLSSVAAFSRAGYGKQAADLAELAVKTQLVGDVTEETANQFLLSVDKAYQFQGSIEKLTAVLDGANELDNKYATSIEKIAEGLGVVAPVAAQAHVGIDELAAGIGTITAVTQRSGTEAARALRAIFLNIVGDTKTEIEEGVTWTTGEIAGLRDVIRQYAPEAYKAAEATGAVIDPMEAIGGLAKSMQEGLLTEQELFEMVSDIGGKLRTSQLLAIVQSWDSTYLPMLEDFNNAVGSADREVENALDSWTVKANQLKNEWTELISHLLDTQLVKDALDALIRLVDLLDTEFGRAVIAAALLSAAFAALNKATKGEIASSIATLIDSLMGYSTSATVAATATEGLAGAMTALKIAAGLLAIGAVIALMDALTVSAEESKAAYEAAKTAAETAQANYDALVAQGGEYDTLKSKADTLAGADYKRLQYLEGQVIALERINNLKKKEEWEAFQNQKAQVWLDSRTGEYYTERGSGTDADFRTKRTVNMAGYAQAKYNSLVEDIGSGKVNADDARAGYVADLSDYISELKNYQEIGIALSEEEEDAIRRYEAISRALGAATAAASDAGDAEETLSEKAARSTQTIDELKAATTALTAAQKELAEYGGLTSDTLAELEALFPGLTAAIYDQSGALTDEGIAFLNTDDAMRTLHAAEIIFNNSTLDVSGKIAALQALAMQAGVTATMIAMVTGEDGWKVRYEIDERVAAGESRESAEVNAFLGGYRRMMAFAPKDGGGGKGGGGGGSKKSAQEQAIADEVEWWKAKAEAVAQYYDAQTAALEAQKDALEQARDTEKERLTLAEKELAVAEARAALENAQNERTVRQWNAQRGQWEWVARAEDVKSAEKALKNAEQELADYKLQMQIDELQRQIDASKDAAKSLNDAIDGYVDALQNGALDLGEAIKTLAAALSSSSLPQGLSADISKGLGSSAAYSQVQSNGLAKAGLDIGTIVQTANGNYQIVEAGTPGASYNPASGYHSIRVFDSGGVLNGMGGIKATEADELILPPDITSAMLTPRSSERVQTRFDELRWLYGGKQENPSSVSNIGTVNNGGQYRFGNIVISSEQARSMSIYDLVEMSKGLGIYGART